MGIAKQQRCACAPDCRRRERGHSCPQPRSPVTADSQRLTKCPSLWVWSLCVFAPRPGRGGILPRSGPPRRCMRVEVSGKRPPLHGQWREGHLPHARCHRGSRFAQSLSSGSEAPCPAASRCLVPSLCAREAVPCNDHAFTFAEQFFSNALRASGYT